MLRTYYLSHAGYDVGVLCRHVIILMYIGGKVVEMGHTFLHYHLPVAHTEAYLVGLVKFPVQVFMSLLPFGSH